MSKVMADDPAASPAALQPQWNQMFQEFIGHVTAAPMPVSEGAGQEMEEFAEDGLPVSTLLRNVSTMVNAEIVAWSHQNQTEPLPMEVTDDTHFAALAHSAWLYLETCLEKDVCDQLAARCAEACARWWCTNLLLGSKDTQALALFEAEAEDAMLTVMRVALFTKFPECAEEGLMGIDGKPVFYLHAHSPYPVERLCLRLGLPKSAGRLVPCNTYSGSSYTMDMAALETMMADDVAAGYTPFFLQMIAGILAVQHTDDIPVGIAHAQKHGVWTHVVGPSAMLLLAAPGADGGRVLPPSIAAVADVDSFTIETQNVLFGTQSDTVTPLCSFFQRTIPTAVPLNQLPLPSLFVLQLRLQQRGTRRLQEQVQRTITEAQSIAALLSHHDDLVTQPFAHESAPHVVCFTYKPPSDTKIPEAKLVEMANNRTVAVFEAQQDRLPAGVYLVQGEPAEDKVSGHLICFDPLNLPATSLSDEQLAQRDADLDMFVKMLLDAYAAVSDIEHDSKRFAELAVANEYEVVDVDGFLGLGCIRFQPTYIEKLSADFLQDRKALEYELTSFHEAVLESLTADDPSVFVAVESPPPGAAEPPHEGPGENGAPTPLPCSACCIGVLALPASEEIDSLDKGIQVVLAHVTQACEAEEARKFLETLGHTVKHVINVAEERLTQSKDDAAYQEGFMRHIPVVGSIVNLVSPPVQHAVQGWQWEIPNEILDDEEQAAKDAADAAAAAEAEAAAAAAQAGQ